MAKRTRVRIFRALQASLTEALRYEQGKPVDLRVSKVPSPPKPLSPAEIRRIRLSLHASQGLFARFLNVSPNAVESWEQGVRRPQRAALKLLSIAKRNPQVLTLT